MTKSNFNDIETNSFHGCEIPNQRRRSMSSTNFAAMTITPRLVALEPINRSINKKVKRPIPLNISLSQYASQENSHEQ